MQTVCTPQRCASAVPSSGILRIRQPRPGRGSAPRETTPDMPQAVGERREGTWCHRCSLPCRSLPQFVRAPFPPKRQVFPGAGEGSPCHGLIPPAPWAALGTGGAWREGGWARFRCLFPYGHIFLLCVNFFGLSSDYSGSPKLTLTLSL